MRFFLLCLVFAALLWVLPGTEGGDVLWGSAILAWSTNVILNLLLPQRQEVEDDPKGPPQPTKVSAKKPDPKRSRSGHPRKSSAIPKDLQAKMKRSEKKAEIPAATVAESSPNDANDPSFA